jgi:hypothetical protein
MKEAPSKGPERGGKTARIPVILKYHERGKSPGETKAG